MKTVLDNYTGCRLISGRLEHFSLMQDVNKAVKLEYTLLSNNERLKPIPGKSIPKKYPFGVDICDIKITN